MKRLLIIFASILLSTSSLQAQVDREVEVTKAYIPTVERAEKPILKAFILDTAYINPDVDYSITPLSINTQLQTRPINPATVTYWEFNKPASAQIKLGAGLPLNSLFQGYISSHNASVGYVAANIDHKGNYSNILSSSGSEVNATQLLNSGSVAGGLYVGDRTLSAEVDYYNNFYDNYAFEQYKSPYIGYQQVGVSAKFGDKFIDLSTLNFSLGALYNHFFDRSSNSNDRLFVSGVLAREFDLGNSYLIIDYKHIDSSSYYENSALDLSLSLQNTFASWQMNLGATYHFDKSVLLNSNVSSHYIIPQLLFSRVKSSDFTPFVQASGAVADNSYSSLSQVNPYIAANTSAKSSVEYNLAGGIMGQNRSASISYKVHLGYDIGINSRYWQLVIVEEPSYCDSGIYESYFNLALNDLYTTSFNAELNFSPLTSLMIKLDGHYFLYSGSSSSPYINSRPNFEASATLEYTLRKVRLGVACGFMGERSFTAQYLSSVGDVAGTTTQVNLPVAIDLSAFVDWRASEKLSVFVEGSNLCDANLYPWPLYRGYGAQFTAGVKINFW